MARIADIRVGIADAIKAGLPNVKCTGFLLENPTSPAIEVELASITYDLSMGRGLDDYTFTIRGFASSGVLDEMAQRTLDTWLASTGTSSVKAALESDPTLGGTVNRARVERTGPIRTYTPISSPGSTFFGAEWTLRCHAPGD